MTQRGCDVPSSSALNSTCYHLDLVDLDRRIQPAWNESIPSRTAWWWLEPWNCYDFPYIGNVIIPSDELIFFRWVGIPPTRVNQHQQGWHITCCRQVSQGAWINFCTNTLRQGYLRKCCAWKTLSVINVYYSYFCPTLKPYMFISIHSHMSNDWVSFTISLS